MEIDSTTKLIGLAVGLFLLFLFLWWFLRYTLEIEQTKNNQERIIDLLEQINKKGNDL